MVLAFTANGEKTLRELGLTLAQARVYLALAKLGNRSTVKDVSVFSKVARQDVYRTLNELQELSLVEMVVGNPTSFRAIQLQEAITILMDRKNQQTHALMAEAAELCKFFPAQKEDVVQQESHQFVLIPKKEVLIRRAQKFIDSSENTILVYGSWRVLNQLIFALHDSWKQALNRGVLVRWIIEEQGETPAESNALSKIMQTLVKGGNLKVKKERTSLTVKFSVYDNRELFISIQNTPNAIDSPVLWTNNPAFVSLLKDYFEMKWQLSEDYDYDRIVA